MGHGESVNGRKYFGAPRQSEDDGFLEVAQDRAWTQRALGGDVEVPGVIESREDLARQYPGVNEAEIDFMLGVVQVIRLTNQAPEDWNDA